MSIYYAVTYYFAARYSRRAELCGYRDILLKEIPSAGVSSAWLDRPQGKARTESFALEYINAHPEECWGPAHDDLRDVEAADVIVTFTDGASTGKGGRHIELGYFLGLRTKQFAPCPRVVIIGPRENIFHCYPFVEIYPDFDAFLAAEIAATSSGRTSNEHHS